MRFVWRVYWIPVLWFFFLSSYLCRYITWSLACRCVQLNSLAEVGLPRPLSLGFLFTSKGCELATFSYETSTFSSGIILRQFQYPVQPASNFRNISNSSPWQKAPHINLFKSISRSHTRKTIVSIPVLSITLQTFYLRGHHGFNCTPTMSILQHCLILPPNPFQWLGIQSNLHKPRLIISPHPLHRTCPRFLGYHAAHPGPCLSSTQNPLQNPSRYGRPSWTGSKQIPFYKFCCICLRIFSTPPHWLLTADCVWYRSGNGFQFFRES